MENEIDNRVWIEKGATLSHKNAMKEYKLEEEEIIEALRSGKLHYKINYIHGNPYYKLIRKEIEKYIEEKQGKNHLIKTKLRSRIDQIEKEIRKHKSQIKRLEKERKEISKKLVEIK